MNWEWIARKELHLSLLEETNKLVQEPHGEIARAVQRRDNVGEAVLRALSRLAEFYSLYLDSLVEIAEWSDEDEEILEHSIEIVDAVTSEIQGRRKGSMHNPAWHGAVHCQDLAEILEKRTDACSADGDDPEGHTVELTADALTDLTRGESVALTLDDGTPVTIKQTSACDHERGP